MNINSRPATTEKGVPCVFSIELFPFIQGRSLDAKFLPGGSTKLQLGMSQILTHKPDRNTAVSVTLAKESSQSHKQLGLRPQNTPFNDFGTCEARPLVGVMAARQHRSCVTR